MPGIAGIITKMQPARAAKDLATMVQAMRHEAFYETGAVTDEKLGVYVGWTARKGSFSDGMPLRNERGDVQLIFSGEEYPARGIAAELRTKGHVVKETGPDYLVHVYEEDPGFPVSLNGMFHGALLDQNRQQVALFNDRFGMHPIYYYESKEAFYFAAEAKAILAVCPELRSCDPRSLGEFVSMSCVLEDRTLFQGIQVLPGGSSWIFRNATLERKGKYFDPREWEQQPALDSEAYYRELRGALLENLPKYFNGNEKIGMTLTGGLDTRVIMANQKHASKSIPCYTFGGMFRDCHDVKIARRVAEVCGQTHSLIKVDEEFLKQFPHYAERTVYLTEGGVDVYRASDLFVSERARAIAPAKVVGTYGSEIVRQAVMFKPKAPPTDLFKPELLSSIREAQDTYAERRREHPVTFAAFRQSPWYHHGILGLEQTQLTVRSPYLDNEFVRAVYRAPKNTDPNEDVRLRLIADGDSTLARIRSDRGVGGAPGLGSFLSRTILEFSFKSEYAYDYGMPQWVSRADHALESLKLERLFLGRHKFTHYRVWYRDHLSDYLREVLLDPRTLSRPYLNRRGVEAVVKGHTVGGLNYTMEIHKLLTLELLQRAFFDRQP